MDIRQSPAYARYMQDLGWTVARAGNSNVFIRHFPLPVLSFFSVIKVQRYEAIDLKSLETIAQTHHAILVKLEPGVNFKSSILNLKSSGFAADDWPLLPSKTLVLDLETLTLDSLPKDTRYEIRKAEKSNLHVIARSVSDKTISFLFANTLEIFIRSWHLHARRKRFWVPLKKEIRALAQAFGSNSDCLLFLSYLSDLSNLGDLNPVAGALVVTHQKTAHYMYAFSTPEGRKVSASYLLLWKIIQFLKKQKVRFLDLEGIYDARYSSATKNWQGFTAFKMQWGGKVVEYPGSFRKLCFPSIRCTTS